MDGGSATGAKRAPARVVTEEQLARLRVALLKQAPVFDDPIAYQSGVEDALAAVLDLTEGDRASVIDLATHARR
jgi:hypothetical protein